MCAIFHAPLILLDLINRRDNIRRREDVNRKERIWKHRALSQRVSVAGLQKHEQAMCP